MTPPTQPPADDRPRRWYAWIIRGVGGPVVVRRCAVLAADEVLERDDPPTVELTWEQWAATHEEYGLDIAGLPLAGPAPDSAS